MINRSLFFSALLPVRFPEFFKDLSSVLKSSGVVWRLLPYTRDVWCRDYMPVQATSGEFVQFKYDPAYLQTKKLRLKITDASKACKVIGVKPRISDLVVDGGNIIRFASKAIMTERVYSENPDFSKEALEYLLKDLLKVRELIMIPEEPGDPYGHADGCVRFVNEKTVLINKSHKHHPAFDRALRKILKENHLSSVELPYSIDNDPRHRDSAVGNYVNYLQVGDLIVVPAYVGYNEQNQLALNVLRRVFRRKKVVQVEATSLAKDGGVLNCVSWIIEKGLKWRH